MRPLPRYNPADSLDRRGRRIQRCGFPTQHLGPGSRLTCPSRAECACLADRPTGAVPTLTSPHPHLCRPPELGAVPVAAGHCAGPRAALWGCGVSDEARRVPAASRTIHMAHIGGSCLSRPGESSKPPGDTLALFRLGGPFQPQQRGTQRHFRQLTRYGLERNSRHYATQRDDSASVCGGSGRYATHVITRSTADYRSKNGRLPDSSSR